MYSWSNLVRYRILSLFNVLNCIFVKKVSSYSPCFNHTHHSHNGYHRDEANVLPIALPVLLSISPSTYFAVRGMTLRLIGELSNWISKHPDILSE